MNAVAFLVSSLVVIMAPGPDLTLITSLVLNGSLRVATAAAFGMITAGALQASLGAAGLAALLAARPHLFTAFRWTGAIILLGWAGLALRRFCRPGCSAGPAASGAAAGSGDAAGCEVPAPGAVAFAADAAVAQVPASHNRHAFAQGLLCTGSNPKVGIFLMAFLPQFVPAGMAPGTGVALLAACYLVLVLIWLLTWMRLVRRIARHLRSAPMLRVVDGLTAAVFSAFAMRLVFGG